VLHLIFQGWSCKRWHHCAREHGCIVQDLGGSGHNTTTRWAVAFHNLRRGHPVGDPGCLATRISLPPFGVLSMYACIFDPRQNLKFVLSCKDWTPSLCTNWKIALNTLCHTIFS
jgi:hypothetical protein